MAEKVEFKDLLNYGTEIILANVSLLIFSTLIGGGLTLWLGKLIPADGLLGVAGGLTLFTALTYTLLLPALIYKIIADSVAKGHELKNQVEK